MSILSGNGFAKCHVGIDGNLMFGRACVPGDLQCYLKKKSSEHKNNARRYFRKISKNTFKTTFLEQQRHRYLTSYLLLIGTCYFLQKQS